MRSFVSCTCSLVVFTASAAAAPLEATLKNDDPLHDDRHHHSYLLDGDRGQLLRVAMKAKSFAPHVIIQNPDGEVVARVTGGGPGQTVAVDLPLRESGSWLVMAMGTEPGETGPYVLDLDVSSPDVAAAAETGAAQPVADALPPKVAPEPAFCDAVMKLVSTAPRGFDGVRGDAHGDNRWTSKANLPGAVSCDIVKFDNYSAVCHVASESDANDIVDAFNDVSGKLRSCLDWSWSHAPTGGIEQYFVGSSGPITIAVSLSEVGGDAPYTLVMSVDVAG